MTLDVFTVEYIDPHSSCITDRLYEQYCAGQHVDVNVRIENDSVALHGFLLAAQSDLLKRSPAQPNYDGKICIDLTKICDSIVHLKSVIDYLYKRTILLNMSNIKTILKLSQYCNFERLSVHCKQFLLNRIQPCNCLKIWRIARSYHLPDIEVMTLSLIKEMFWEICKKDHSLKEIGTKEMNFLMDKVSIPRKPIAAIEFMIYWLSGNFSERFSVVSVFVQRLIPNHCIPSIIERLGSFLSQDEQYRPLLNVLQTIATNVPEKKYYNSPYSHDENWALALSERNLVSIYFPTENQWTTLEYETDDIKIIGILGQTVLSWDKTKKHIGIFNLETLTAQELPPCPLYYMSAILAYEYFCTNTGVHMVACSWYGCGFKVIIWRYRYGWEKIREMLISSPLQTAYMGVQPCPTDSNMAYIFISSRMNEKEISPGKHGCLLLRYDSLATRIAHVFESDNWAPLVDGRLLCIGNTINFLEDFSSRQLLKSLTLGKITVKSIVGRDELKTFTIPITVSKRKRPGNISVMADMANNMCHLDIDQFTCYSDNIFRLEQISPTVVSVSIYNFTGDDKWVDIPPSPLLGLSPMKFKIFNRNSILRGGFCVKNEKQLISKTAFPFVNLAIDGWKDEILTGNDLYFSLNFPQL